MKIFKLKRVTCSTILVFNIWSCAAVVGWMAEEVISSFKLFPTVVSEVVPIAYLSYSFYLSNSKWPRDYFEVESFASDDDSLRLSARYLFAKYKSLHFTSDTTRLLNIQFELAPISNDSIRIQKTFGSITIQPPVLTRKDTVSIRFNSLIVHGIETWHHDKWIKSSQMEIEFYNWLNFGFPNKMK